MGVACTPTVRVTVGAGVLTGGIVTSSSGGGGGGGGGKHVCLRSIVLVCVLRSELRGTS